MLFNPHTEANEVLVDVFAGDLGVLKEAYLAISTAGKHDYYDGQSFNRILDADPAFLVEYIDARCQSKNPADRYADRRDYRFLWKRFDYEELGRQIVERAYEWEVKRHVYSRTTVHMFFSVKEVAQTEAFIAERQDRVIRALIERHHDDADFIQFVFSLISEFVPERRLAFIAQFLGLNKSYEVFTCLEIEPHHWSWGGSAVPMYQKRVEYLESVLPLLDTADLLKHKQLIEGQIQWLRGEIEREKKSDFIDADE